MWMYASIVLFLHMCGICGLVFVCNTRHGCVWSYCISILFDARFIPRCTIFTTKGRNYFMNTNEVLFLSLHKTWTAAIFFWFFRRYSIRRKKCVDNFTHRKKQIRPILLEYKPFLCFMKKNNNSHRYLYLVLFEMKIARTNWNQTKTTECKRVYSLVCPNEDPSSRASSHLEILIIQCELRSL